VRRKALRINCMCYCRVLSHRSEVGGLGTQHPPGVEKEYQHDSNLSRLLISGHLLGEINRACSELGSRRTNMLSMENVYLS
jgi:hypothetical protein